VITFRGNPKDPSLPSLDTLRLRERRISSFSVNYFSVIDLNSEIIKLSGDEFIRLLCTMCRVKAVIVGGDFRCGNRKGQVTAQMLSASFSKCGEMPHVEICPEIKDRDGNRISSTELRRMISEGDFSHFGEYSPGPYALDLMGLPIIESKEGLEIERKGLTQLLPPNGDYRGILFHVDGRKEDVKVEVLDERVCAIGDGIGCEGLDELVFIFQGEEK